MSPAGPDLPRRSDYLAVGLFAFVLFAYTAFSGRPLTMHEARLPQTAREMLATHHWLLPTSGTRPWLERPPLPHWVVAAAMTATGRVDAVWVVRLPSAVMGTATVLLTIWTAGRCFGRTIGRLGGVILATAYEFYLYAGSAEDDVYLAALVAVAMALFVRRTFAHGDVPAGRFWAARTWDVWAFFAVVGLTNLAKGPLLGVAFVGSAVGAYAVWDGIVTRRWSTFARYTWLWGWLLMLTLTVAWPAWAAHRYPDVVDNWKYDYLGRMSGAYSDINQPWWYYAPTWAVALLPWTPACVVGLLATRRRVTDADGSAWRFVWCWAFVPLLLLSVPHGKHHHYLVPLIAPSATLAAVGTVEIGRFLFRRTGGGAGVVTAVAAVLAVAYGTAMTAFAGRTDHTLADTAFLARVRAEVPPTVPLFIDAKLGPVGNLDFFRLQFYSRPDAVLLHNLSFLRDERITAPTVYVIARGPAAVALATLGTVRAVDASPDSHEAVVGRTRYGNFTLFRLTFDPHLTRYPAPPTVTSLQAMERAESTAPGPFCGPPL